MHLITMKCPACAANVNIDNDNSFFKCEYCKNQISIIKPTSINTNVESLDLNDQKLFSNYVSILEQSMKAGNYGEAYNYCNKALEINPHSGSLWENKAICSFWLSSLENLSFDKANEITTYLNASKQNEPESNTYQKVAETIADNLYLILLYRYKTQPPEYVQGGNNFFAKNYLMQLVNYINLIELCYQICPKIGYLKTIVELLVQSHIKWLMQVGKNISNTYVSNSIGFNAKQKYDILVKKIQIIDKNYIPVEFKKPDRTLLYVVLGIILLFILGSIFLSIIEKLSK